MCGIFGAIGHSINPRIVHVLGLLNESRGRESTGVYFNGEIAKTDRMASHCLGEFLRPFDWKRDHYILGHTRFSTSGKVCPEFAHPFQIGDVIGVHNGQLYSHHSVNARLGTSYEVDSKILLHLISQSNIKLLESLSWYGTILFMYKTDMTTIYALICGGDFAYGRDTKGNMYFSSSDIHLGQVIDRVKHGKDHGLYSFTLTSTGVSVKRIPMPNLVPARSAYYGNSNRNGYWYKGTYHSKNAYGCGYGYGKHVDPDYDKPIEKDEKDGDGIIKKLPPVEQDNNDPLLGGMYE